MKRLKTRVVYTIIILLISFWACNPDEDDGFNDDPRDKFLGNWVCSEKSSLNGASTFTVTIAYDASNSSNVTISNFYHFGSDQKAVALVTNNNLTINQQTLCSTTIKGSGSLSSDKINWKYYVNNGADLDTVTAIYSK